MKEMMIRLPMIEMAASDNVFLAKHYPKSGRYIVKRDNGDVSVVDIQLRPVEVGEARRDFTLGMRIAKHFYEMGCKRGAELQRQDLPKWKKTPTGGCWSGEIGVRPTARLFTYEHYSINADKLFEQLEKED